MYVHISIGAPSGQLLHSTRLEESGSGVPMALVLGRGVRAPRGWELGLQGDLVNRSIAHRSLCRISACDEILQKFTTACAQLHLLRDGVYAHPPDIDMSALQQPLPPLFLLYTLYVHQIDA